MVVDLVGSLRALETEMFLDTPTIETPLKSAGVTGHVVGIPVYREGIVRVRVEERPLPFIVDECAARIAATFQMVYSHLVGQHMSHQN